MNTTENETDNINESNMDDNNLDETQLNNDVEIDENNTNTLDNEPDEKNGEQIATVDTINNQTKHLIVDSMRLVSDILLSPYLLLVSSALIVYLYIRENSSLSLMGIFSDLFIWTLFTTVIIAHLMYQIYGVKMHTVIFNVLNISKDTAKTIFNIKKVKDVENTEEDDNENNDVDGDVDDDENNKEEVFHIPGNYYNYNQAQELCAAYDSRLATYDEIEEAYKDGAEWCSYGWSDGQMAFFPTQKETYKKLQNTSNEKHNCGRQGINGGFMTNPELRFGANCYGIKPKQRERDELYMKASSVPRHSRNSAGENNAFSSMIDKITVSGFNYDKWNHVERI